MMADRMTRVGVDFGGVLVRKATIDDGVSLFGSEYREARDVPGSVDGVAFLVNRFGPENVFVLSKAGEETARRTREWLLRREFYTRTGLLHDHVHFCAKRQDKVPLAQEFGLTHMIDDTEQIVRFFCGTPIQPIWFTDDVRMFGGKLRDVPRCAGWPDVVRWFAGIA